MPISLIIGAACGLASALLFYAATRGAAALGFVLFILTPLPSAIAGLCWGWPAAVAAGLAGASAMAGLALPQFGIGYFLAIGVPAAGLAYLSNLGRNRAEGSVDWYPAGWILAALVIYAGLFPILIAPLFGGSYAILQVPYQEFVRLFSNRMGQPMTDAQAQAWGSLLVEVTPASIAAYFLLIWVINAYLAGRIARGSGRLLRPWPDLHRLEYPSGTSLLFGAAILATMLQGVPRVIGTAMSGAMLVGFALIGLAILHCISKGRIPWMLWLSYALLLTPVAPYVVIGLALVGLADGFLNIRDRVAGPPGTGAGPPPPAV
jgi:hypothetical protein